MTETVKGPERCPQCGRTDDAFAMEMLTCTHPWHGDDHLRRKAAARLPSAGISEAAPSAATVAALQEAEIARLTALVADAAWRTDWENAPTKAHEYFLVRPRGLHPGKGQPFLPTIVQRIDGEFYTTDNELEPVYFGQDESEDHPLKTTLEWKPLPADWLSVSSTVGAPK